MATRNFNMIATNVRNAHVVQWTGLLPNDDGQPLEMGQFADRSVQFSGSFGSATIRLEGSNTGTDWAPLADPNGNPLEASTPKIEGVLEATRYVRPVVVGGTGTSATVTLFVKE